MFMRWVRAVRRPRRTRAVRRATLLIEPLEGRCQPSALTYSSYLGGNNSDGVTAVATDAAGDIYLAGRVNSDTFPGVAGTVPLFHNGFVVKMDPTGSTLIWTCVILCDTDGVRGLAVDAAGNAYVTGSTGVTSGFATTGAAQTAFGGNGDAFAVKVNANGTIAWATYLGGEQIDFGRAIAVNRQGDVFVIGDTVSSHFPTHNPLSGQSTLQANSGRDGFITEISPNGAQFLFSSYLGGNQNGPGEGGATPTDANAIALDKAGNVYLTGDTEAADFPTTANAFQATKGYAYDAFITELSPDGSQILYSSFLSGPGQTVDSGNGYDVGYGVAIDGAGNILVTGSTTSLHFPVKNAFQGRLDRGSPALEDAFVTKLNPNKLGSAQLVYSTYDGGSAIDFGQAIAVDAAGNAYVAGYSSSDTLLGKFPVVNPFQSTQDPGTAFIAKFSPGGGLTVNSKYGRAGSGYENEDTPAGAIITVSPFGTVIFAGDSGSNHLQIIGTAFQSTFTDATDSGYFAMFNGKLTKSFSGVDADGDPYTVSLSGPGALSVVQDDPGNTGVGPIKTIYLKGTDPSASVLTIHVTRKVGDGFISVGGIVGPGLLQIAAGTADLAGTGTGINLTGKLGSLTIHDVHHSVLAQDLPTQSTSITAHVIGAGVDVNVGGMLGTLKAAQIGACTIRAPRIANLNVTGDASANIAGDFDAKLTLTGAGTALPNSLPTATIAGTVNGADIEVQAGNVGTFRAGAFIASTLFLGQSHVLTAGQRLSTITVTGILGSLTPAFTASNVSASTIGTVTLASVQINNGGTTYGIHASTAITAVHVTMPKFAYDPKQPTPQKIGDFSVTLP
jgi:hypothetical protein